MLHQHVFHVISIYPRSNAIRCEAKYTVQYNPKNIIAIIRYYVMQKSAIGLVRREVTREEDNKYLGLNETGRNN